MSQTKPCESGGCPKRSHVKVGGVPNEATARSPRRHAGRAAAGRAAALRLRRLASARPRPSLAPSSPPAPSPPPPLPTITAAAPPPAASAISPRRQQLWPSPGCRRRRHACRCRELSWLAPLDAVRGAVQSPILAACSCIVCWLLAAALSCAWKLHWNALMRGICLCLREAWAAWKRVDS